MQETAAGPASQFSCLTPSLYPGLALTWRFHSCSVTGTPAASNTATPAGASATATARASTTPLPGTATPAPSTSTTPLPGTATLPPGTATPCVVQFTDVPAGSPFYPYIRCLACRGIVSDYADATFRPYNPVNRGQLAKFVANAAGYRDAIPPSRQTFTDVPASHPFWLYIERVAAHGVVSGYADGTFRPANSVTRGQAAKFVAGAAGYVDLIPAGQQSFTDVLPADPFWLYVERVYAHAVISGYTCGAAPAGACDPAHRPWFLPLGSVTRGQTAKLIGNAFFPGCATPAR